MATTQYESILRPIRIKSGGKSWFSLSFLYSTVNDVRRKLYTVGIHATVGKRAKECQILQSRLLSFNMGFGILIPSCVVLLKTNFIILLDWALNVFGHAMCFITLNPCCLAILSKSNIHTKLSNQTTEIDKVELVTFVRFWLFLVMKFTSGPVF